MKKIVFGITSLTIGGAEKVLIDLANTLKDKYEITILSIYAGGQFVKQVDKRIKIVNIFEHARKQYGLLKRILISLCFLLKPTRVYIYNKYLKNRYDVEIAFLEGPITTLFSTYPKDNSVAWIHNDIKLVFGSGLKAKLKRRVNKKTYSKYKRLVFVSEDNLNKFNEVYNISNNKRVIYNYIDPNRVITRTNELVPTEINTNLASFLVVARLVEQKGLMRLLTVHKHLIDNGFKHRVYIVGDGPLKSELLRRIESFNLTDSFVLLGLKENPYPYMKKADVVILPSIYEGYGMVIIEARILKKYILITDTAAREALIGYKNSMIVSNNEEGLYIGMKKIIENKHKKYTPQTYSNKKIIDEIIELIES